MANDRSATTAFPTGPTSARSTRRCSRETCEILDSNVDPRGVWYQDNFDQDVAFQRNIEIWFGWLAKYNSVYHLGSTESQVARTFSNAQNALARSPAGGEVGPDEWPDIFLEAGYYEQTWEDLGSLFSEWINSPGPASASDPVNAFESTDGVGDDNGYAGYLAVQCSDTAWPSSWPKIVRDNWAVYARAPFETWGSAWFNGPCTNWPGRAGRPVQIDGSRVNSALLIDETLDAATPFPGSLEVRTLFPHASLIAEPGAPATPTRCLVTRASTARSRITSRRALCPHVSASRRGTRHAPRCRNRTRRRRRPPPRCVPRDRRPGPPHLRRLRPLGSPERLAAGFRLAAVLSR
ncbi:MAG: alpha/beta hydrolase [Solirubrobacteraceae bacterium]